MKFLREFNEFKSVDDVMDSIEDIFADISDSVKSINVFIINYFSTIMAYDALFPSSTERISGNHEVQFKIRDILADNVCRIYITGKVDKEEIKGLIDRSCKYLDLQLFTISHSPDRCTIDFIINKSYVTKMISKIV